MRFGNREYYTIDERERPALPLITPRCLPVTLGATRHTGSYLRGFDVVRPEMDVTQETQRGIFRGASRCCCSFASLSFLSCKNQPARTQSKRSDFKRRSSSSCVHLAFEWLLFTRNWCWQAQQSNFSRRFAPHFPSRAINSTHKRAAAGHLY